MPFQKGNTLGTGNSGPRTHGLSRSPGGAHTPQYAAWAGMIQRCENPDNTGWEDYGGRGIAVCSRWHSYEKFFEDMGARPVGKTLDRFPDCNGDYAPGNCRWATPEEQSNNTRVTRWISWEGETLSISQWSRKLGVTVNKLYGKIYRGMAPAQALSCCAREGG